MEPIGATANSTTRQKSCNNCVKSKRGCDKRFPVCSRCEEKNFVCVYAKLPQTDTVPALYGFEGIELDPSSSNSADVPAASLNSCVSTFAAAPTPLAPAVLSDSMDSLLGLVESGSSPSEDLWLIPCPGDDIDIHEEPGEPVLNTANYAKMNDICAHYASWQVYDPNSKPHFIVQAFKSFHRNFACDGQTPFLHRHLYRDNMPELVLSCFTTSSLYANQNAKTRPLVLRALQRAIDELKQQHLANTPQDRLARAQVLFLYQTIRLFDGDLTLRACAERDMPLLQSWLDELSRIRGNLGALSRMDDIGIRSTPPESWERWIFAESVRRTVVMGNSFIAAWKIMHGGDHSAGAWAYIHRWTLSRALWEAPSSFSFFCVWRENAQYIISNYEFENFLKNGCGNDVDDFARILLVTYMGLDETQQWFMDTGSVF